ncbi:MAG: lipoyl(octanoyl) transferase LipB [Methylococcales bacterium]
MENQTIQTKILQTELQSYQSTYASMREFTTQRTDQTPDQIWVLQHHPVYTIGSNSHGAEKPQSTIPVIQSDRGGQITYHGPGQLIIYLLLDLHRRKLSIRKLVAGLELAIINLLRQYAIKATSRESFPGVYVNQSKIASVGLRVRNGCSYHGISLNVNMDLEPFNHIVICGQNNLTATQISDLGGPNQVEQLAAPLIFLINQSLNLDINNV